MGYGINKSKTSLFTVRIRAVMMPLLDMPLSNGTLVTAYLITSYEDRTMLETTRTDVACTTNHSQVRDDLNACGFAASELWNAGRYYSQSQWVVRLTPRRCLPRRRSLVSVEP
jgi:hypothetical protein